MSLGYCILHANRIDAALLPSPVDEHVTGGDEVVDLLFGTFSIGEPDQLLKGYIQGVVAEFQKLTDRVQQAASTGGGLLADLQRWIADLTHFSFDEFRLTPLIDRVAELLAALDPARIVAEIDKLLERLAVAFPELTGSGLLDRILQIVLGGLDVFERRRLDGNDDIPAHRAFRMARILRAWLGDALADVRARLAEFNPIAWLRRGVSQLLVGIDSPGSGPLREIGETIKTKLRPFAVAIDALLALRVSVSVSASVQTLPDEGELWLDENMVTPHPRGHWLWILDLVSGGVAFIESCFDSARFTPWYGARWVDGLLNFLSLAWQVARTAVRAARPDFLRENHSRSGAAFWFSELGDFCVQLFLNLCGSFHEGKNGANWAMSLACRLSRWFSFTLQPRIPYLFLRAVDYHQKWKDQGWVEEVVVQSGDTIESIASARGIDPVRLRTWNRIVDQPKVGDTLIIVPNELGERPGRKRAPIAFGQHVWLSWTFAWVLGVFFGLIQTWDDFRLQELGGAAIAKLVISLVLAFIAMLVMPYLLAGGNWANENHPYEIDYLTFSILIGFLAIITIVLSISMKSTNTTRGIWWVGLVAGIVLTLAPLLLVLMAWRMGTPGAIGVATWSLYWYGVVIGLIVFNLLTMIYWWTYADDGRDKHDEFKAFDLAGTLQPLDATKAPYKLPWKKDDVWICGQGFHGNFSHTYIDAGNHFGYDFLECENTPAVAARGGIVVAVTQGNANNNEPQNDIHVVHLDWVAGHDPGTEDERVLTSSGYIHLSQRHAHVHIDQFVLQGQNIIDIDSTGTSAQHHLHYGAAACRSVDEMSALASVDANYWQRHTNGWHLGRDTSSIPAVRGRVNLPNIYHASHRTLFADGSVQRDRTNPLFWTFSNRRGTPGRPMSQCLYKSDNELKSPPARPLLLRTQGDHVHELHIDLAALPLDGRLAAPLELWTTIVDGHRHRVTISAEAMSTLLGHRLPNGFATAETLSHTHPFDDEARSGARMTATAHWFWKKPVAIQEVSPLAQIGLTAPPPAQLVANKPGPYDLLGHRLVFQVDDATTEYHHLAGDRARLLADLAIDRLPAAVPGLVLSPSVTVNLTPGARASTRVGIRAIDASSNTGVPTPSDAKREMPFVFRAIPVLVLETLERGSTARLAVDRAGVVTVQNGSGAIPKRSLTLDELKAVFEAQFDAAPTHDPPPAADVHAQVVGSVTSIDIDNQKIELEAGQRMQAVFAGLYETPTKQLVGSEALPLGPGRLLIWSDATKKLEVPLIGTPARLELDPVAAWLSDAKADETPLRIRLGTTTHQLVLAKSATLADIVAQVHREVEGVRAEVVGGKLVVESVDVGPDVELMIEKNDPTGAAPARNFTARISGEAPKLGSSATAIRDSSLVSRDELVRAIGDAATRAEARKQRAQAITAAPPTKARVTVSVSGTRIELQVPAANRIALVPGDSSTKLVALFGFTRISDQLWRSAELPVAGGAPARLDLPLDGWLDFTVDADTVRIHLDGQPARIELSPFDTVAAAGTKLKVQVGLATEPWTEVDLVSKGAALPMARELATKAGLIARISHRVAIEARHPGNARIALDRAEPLGFLRRAAIEARGGGPVLDLHAVGSADFLDAPLVAHGLIDASTPYTVSLTGAGATTRVVVTAPAGKHVRVEWVGPGADPLTFDGSPGPSVMSGQFETIAMRVGGYRIEVLDTNDLPTSETFVQIGFAPASLRATNPVSARPLVEHTTLTIEVGLVGATQSFVLDLGWAADLVAKQRSATPPVAEATIARQLRERIAEQIQRETAGLDVFFVPVVATAPVLADRLQLASKVAGKQASLRLQGEAAILALGFEPEAIGATILGRGEVDDGARLRPAEVQAAFTQAAAQTTVLANVPRIELRETTRPGPAPASPPVPLLELSAKVANGAPPPVSLAITPALLDAAIPRTAAAGKVEIDMSSPLDLPAGSIRIDRGGIAIGTLFVHGTRASLRSILPPAGDPKEAAEIAWITGFGPTRQLTIEFDGASRTIAMFPASATTLAAAVAFLAEQVPELSIGIKTSGGTRELWLESRVRGARSRVAVRFVGFVPNDHLAHHSFLGFTRDTQSIGSGTFDDLSRVDRPTLLHALRRAAGEVMVRLGSPFTAVAGGRGVQITATTGAGADPTAILQAVPGEGIEGFDGAAIAPLAATASANMLEQAWPAPRALRSGIVRVRWTMASRADQRFAAIPIWAAPARIEATLKPGKTLTNFRGRKLSVEVDRAPAFTCTFSTSTSTWEHVTKQIEQASAGTLLARVARRAGKDTLILTSASEGSRSKLDLRAASPDARDLLDIPSASGSGEGVVDSMRAVAAADLVRAFNAGALVREPGIALVDFPIGHNRPYVAGPKRDAPRLRIRSSQLGCMSAIVPIVGGEPFDFDLSLQRAPAQCAALMIPAQAGARALNGRLRIQFDESSAGPVRQVEVEFAGNYSPAQLAKQIHDVAFAQNVGRAGAYPDDSVVIETLTPGLGGAVRVSAEAPLLGALGLAGATLGVRGWPGQLEPAEGFRMGWQVAPAVAVAPYTTTVPSAPSSSFNVGYFPARGFRGSKTKPITAIDWRFHSGDPSAVPAPTSSAWLTLDPAWNVDTLVARVDQLLRAAGIGRADKADDGTLQIEAQTVLALEIRDPGSATGRPLGVTIPDIHHAGERIDVKPEPGIDLRPTDTLRTLRLIYDRKGTGETDSGLVDAGWVRAPTDPAWGISRDHVTLEPVDFPMWPRGRYLLAARAEAAKHDYGREGEMVVSSGTFMNAGKTIPFVRIARYWVGMTGLPDASPRSLLVPMMNGVRSFNGQILVDWSI